MQNTVLLSFDLGPNKWTVVAGIVTLISVCLYFFLRHLKERKNKQEVLLDEDLADDDDGDEKDDDDEHDDPVEDVYRSGRFPVGI